MCKSLKMSQPFLLLHKTDTNMKKFFLCCILKRPCSVGTATLLPQIINANLDKKYRISPEGTALQTS
jgi:hypothetical protein